MGFGSWEFVSSTDIGVLGVTSSASGAQINRRIKNRNINELVTPDAGGFCFLVLEDFHM